MLKERNEAAVGYHFSEGARQLGGSLSVNFQVMAGAGDLLIDLSIKFEHQNQLLTCMGVADSEATV